MWWMSPQPWAHDNKFALKHFWRCNAQHSTMAYPPILWCCVFGQYSPRITRCKSILDEKAKVRSASIHLASWPAHINNKWGWGSNMSKEDVSYRIQLNILLYYHSLKHTVVNPRALLFMSRTSHRSAWKWHALRDLCPVHCQLPRWCQQWWRCSHLYGIVAQWQRQCLRVLRLVATPFGPHEFWKIFAYSSASRVFLAKQWKAGDEVI